MPLSTVELLRFLRRAKQATYAAQGDAASVPPCLPETKQLEFAEGEYFYRDIYAGSRRFVGQEIVYRAGHAVWSMSYAGGLSPEVPATSARSIYAFLRAALRAAPPELPVRGPTQLALDELRYTCRSTGSVARFDGIECIAQGDAVVYRLQFAGSLLD